MWTLAALVLLAQSPAAEPGEAPTRAQTLATRTQELSNDVAFALKNLPGDHRAQLFAVVPFDSVGPESTGRQLGVVVADLLATELFRLHQVPQVERSALSKVFDEQALGQTGAIDETTAARIGTLAGARAIVVGQVADVADGFRVTVRAVDAETAVVLVAKETTLPTAELISYSADAVVLKSKSGALFRSMVLPGWGQAYNGEPVKGLALGGATIVAGVATVATLAGATALGVVIYPRLGQRPEDKDKSADQLRSEILSTRENSDTLFAVGGVLAGTTAVLYVVTAIDAYVNGVNIDDEASARR